MSSLPVQTAYTGGAQTRLIPGVWLYSKETSAKVAKLSVGLFSTLGCSCNKPLRTGVFATGLCSVDVSLSPTQLACTENLIDGLRKRSAKREKHLHYCSTLSQEDQHLLIVKKAANLSHCGCG